ncbi:hypothetical protein DFJ73DRAFT_664975 [Zopfochytrium polystomum]|nr:hypothetical protein DFJ73DRAFT_664975 [Zopfochytrium polystomum]
MTSSSSKKPTLKSDFRDAFDLNIQFPKYAEYHHNKLNQMIHIVFVPLILWTAMVWFANVPAFASWGLDAYLPLNLSLLLTLVYAGYYIILEPQTGLMFMPILLTMCSTANAFQRADLGGELSPNVAAGLLHASSWVFQFLGHGLAERRAPALFDNLLQALVLAPFFVFFELLFSVGYKPKLAADFEKITVKRIAAWKASSKKD